MVLKTICPICDQEVEIDPGKILRATLHLAETGTVPLVGCPNCCRCLILPPEIPVEGGIVKVEEYLNQIPVDKSWLACLPLPVQLAQEPNGVIDYHGEKLYTPGDDTQGMRKYPYMAKYGVEPECMLAKMKKR